MMKQIVKILKLIYVGIFFISCMSQIGFAQQNTSENLNCSGGSYEESSTGSNVWLAGGFVVGAMEAADGSIGIGNGNGFVSNYSIDCETVPMEANAGTDNEINCEATDLTLNGVTSVGASEYLWTTIDGNIISDANLLSIQVDQAGLYVLTISSSVGCMDSDTVVVTQGNLITWYEDADGDGLGNSTVSQEACEQPQGYVSNSNDTDDDLYSVLTLVRGNLDFEILSTAPVPTTDFINIEFTSTRTGSIDIKIYDIIGKVVGEESYQAIEGVNTARIDLTRYATGTYFMTLNSLEQGNLVTRFIKEK